MTRLLLGLVFLLALARPASATWSIILIDLRTGEIAIASATCLEGFDLAAWVPVIVVGKGAAAAQSFVDSSGQNRTAIRDQLRLGTDPALILAGLAMTDPGHQTRQYGIVDVRGRAVGFTGTGAGAWSDDRVGRIGDIAYAVQGNLLTGAPVLAAMEIAIYTTPGDLAEKLMASMEVARAFGGDGRCSCPGTSATACGAPPASFTKSAHCAFMIVARPGDTDGSSFANGAYYMRLNVANRVTADPDPVLTLRTQFDAWKASQRGRPDHFLSSVTLSPGSLPAVPGMRVSGTLTLRDREGVRITTGGATVSVIADPASSSDATIGPVTDHGDGTYSFTVTSGTVPDRLPLLVSVDDGSGSRLITPTPVVGRSGQLLWIDRTELPVATGGTLDLALQPGPTLGAQRPWVLLASASGTFPGLRVGPLVTLPLNPDPLFDATLTGFLTGSLPAFSGVASPAGLASTRLTFPPGLYTIPAGSTIAFAYAVLDPTTLTVPIASNAVAVGVVP